VKAYTDELLARENVRVAEAAVKTAQSDLQRAQARQEEGQAVPFRPPERAVQLAQAQEDLLQANNASTLPMPRSMWAMGYRRTPQLLLNQGSRNQALKPAYLPSGNSMHLKCRPDLREADLELSTPP